MGQGEKNMRRYLKSQDPNKPITNVQLEGHLVDIWDDIMKQNQTVWDNLRD